MSFISVCCTPLRAIRRSCNVSVLRVLLAFSLLLQTILPIPLSAARIPEAHLAPITDLSPSVDTLADDAADSASELPTFPAADTQISIPQSQSAIEEYATVTVETDRYLLAAGESVTLTVTASWQSTQTLQLALYLPTALQVDVGGVLDWSLDGTSQAENATYTVQATVPASSTILSGVVMKVGAEVVGLGSAANSPAQDEILLGLLPTALVSNEALSPEANAQDEGALPLATIQAEQTVSGTLLLAPEGTVQLLVAPDAAPVGTSFDYAALYRWAGGDDAPLAEDGLDIYQKWQLDAVHSTAAVESFSDSVLLLVATDWLDAEGIDPLALTLWTRPDETAEWERIPALYDAQKELLVAELAHFSQFAMMDGTGPGDLTNELPVSGEILPSIRGFTSDLSTGAANLSYPIEVPTGLGGLAPSLSLSYSSMVIDEMQYDHASKYRTQAGLAGLGWNIGGISYIVQTAAHGSASAKADQYQIILNGSRVSIHDKNQNGTVWEETPRMFWKINRFTSSHPGGGLGSVERAGGWTITTTDGITHTFGSKADPGLQATDPYQSTILRSGNREVVKWYLHSSEDLLGNRIVYKYSAEAGITAPSCAGDVNGSNWYHRSIKPREVLWSSRSDSDSLESNDGNDAMMRVRFVYPEGNRDDRHVDFSENDPQVNDGCVQPTYTDKLLDKVVVEVRKTAGGSDWQQLRAYDLGYVSSTSIPNAPPIPGTTIGHSLLKSIEYLGADNTSPLHTYDFEYKFPDPDPGSNPPETLGREIQHSEAFLYIAYNGWGGKVQFKYEPFYVEHWDLRHWVFIRSRIIKMITKTISGDGFCARVLMMA